ncbi:UNVERIFIED_CONTAM: hypothetical protein K2H54_055623 [Gekko kuhli]
MPAKLLAPANSELETSAPAIPEEEDTVPLAKSVSEDEGKTVGVFTPGAVPDTNSTPPDSPPPLESLDLDPGLCIVTALGSSTQDCDLDSSIKGIEISFECVPPDLKTRKGNWLKTIVACGLYIDYVKMTPMAVHGCVAENISPPTTKCY